MSVLNIDKTEFTGLEKGFYSTSTAISYNAPCIAYTTIRLIVDATPPVNLKNLACWQNRILHKPKVIHRILAFNLQ